MNVDVYDTDTPSSDAPMRAVMLERLHSHWRGIAGAEKIENVALHYFGGKIKVEAQIPLDTMLNLEQAQRFAREMAETAYRDEHVNEVWVLFY